MDHEQFAALTRWIAARGSRRAALLAFLGAALFGREAMLEGDGDDGAAAKGSGGRPGGKQHGRNRGNGRHRSRRHKARDKKKTPGCTGIGQPPQPGQPCCPNLLLDGAGNCTEPSPCAETCAGCCEGETCITTTSDQACGVNGQPCVQCTAPQSCGGGGEPGVCGAAACTPKSCADLGVNCGPVGDGCQDVIDCGPCTAMGQVCGGGGVPSVCGAGTCTPRTCAAQGAQCGPLADGCGGLMQCAPCPAGQTCCGNTCIAGFC